jgi:hypothetical protein
LSFTRATADQSANWLATKLLMHRKTTFEQQRDNYELSEQHEADRMKINQIKQSLLVLKQTQNEEMHRIKEEHEHQMDLMEQAKEREVLDIKQQCET